MKHLKIKVDARGQGSIQVDGKEVEGVVAVGFNSSVDEPTEVTLVLQVDEVEIEAEIDDERFRQVDHERVRGDDDGVEYGHPGDRLRGDE
jgi:hypothetical protein